MGNGGSGDGGGGGGGGGGNNGGGSQNNGGGGGGGKCESAQSHADAACANAGQSDLSGSNAGGDMVSQGMACSAAQDAANQACNK